MRRISTCHFMFWTLIAVAGCDEDGSTNAAAAQAVEPSLGKADGLVGVAEGRCLENGAPDSCGGPGASGDCSCDAACVDNGDCCYDYQAMCGGTEMNFVKLQLNDVDVQPPIFIYTVGGAPGGNPEGFRFEAAEQMFNAARWLSRQELGYDQWGSLMSEPPFTAQVAGKPYPDALGYNTPDWRDPLYMPRYVDALLAWGRFNLSPEGLASLKSIVRDAVVYADQRERGWYLIRAEQGGGLPSSCHPAVCNMSDGEIEDLEHTSIYAIAE